MTTTTNTTAASTTFIALDKTGPGICADQRWSVVRISSTDAERLEQIGRDGICHAYRQLADVTEVDADEAGRIIGLMMGHTDTSASERTELAAMCSTTDEDARRLSAAIDAAWADYCLDAE